MTPETICEAISALSVATAGLGGGFFLTRLTVYLRAHGPVRQPAPRPVLELKTAETQPDFIITMEPSLNGARG